MGSWYEPPEKDPVREEAEDVPDAVIKNSLQLMVENNRSIKPETFESFLRRVDVYIEEGGGKEILEEYRDRNLLTKEVRGEVDKDTYRPTSKFMEEFRDSEET